MSDAVDSIPLTRNVMFIGDYFTLMTTVVMPEELRREGESDEDYAVRLASGFIQDYYGWDIEAVSNEIGVMDDSYEEGDE